MTAPGWFPDPDGSPRLRYFDGTQWTANTANQPAGPPTGAPPPGGSPEAQGFAQQRPPHPGQQYPGQQPSGPQGNFQHQGQQPGFQPYSGQQNGTPPPTPGRKYAWGWVALAVVVVLIIGLATWMLFFRGAPTATPTTGASTATPADPTTGPPSADPIPTEEATSVDPEPTPTAEPTSDVALPPGSIIAPITSCPATATDAIGEVGPDGRLTSGAGLSMAAAEGFVPTPVQYPWVHQSNSQVKQYSDTNWAAAITVGTVRMDEGFTNSPTAAVAIVACILGSDFYDGADPVGKVVNFLTADEGDLTTIAVDVFVQGQPGITSDYLYVMAGQDDGVMHVVISTVPDSDPAGTKLVGEIVTSVGVG